MSKVQVMHIESYLRSTFAGLIDLSDAAKKTDEERDKLFLTRSLAAFALCHLADASPEEAGKAIVDSYEDHGIDAILCDEATKEIWLVQSKWIADGEGEPDNGDVKKFTSGVYDLQDMRFDRFNDKVRAIEPQIMEALRNSSVRLRVVLVYPGQSLSKHSQWDLDDLLQRLNEASEWVTTHVVTKKELYRAAIGQAKGEPINLSVLLRDWGAIKDPYTAYYGQVAAIEVAQWWADNKYRLFEQNLRKFKGRTEVNEKIISTLKTMPQHFWYFNNGITVLCDSVEKAGAHSGSKSVGYFDCKGVSVINGAQTVGSIGYVHETSGPDALEGASVIVRFISLKDTPSGLGKEITVATNTQNRVEEKDFAALDSVQKELAEELEAYGKTYVYQGGDERTRTDTACDLEEAAVSLACAYEDVAFAVQAKREVGQLWDRTESFYGAIFDLSSLRGLKLWRCVEVQRLVDAKLKVKQPAYLGRDRQILVHGNRLISHLVFQRLYPGRFMNPKLEFDKEKLRVEDLVETTFLNLKHAVETLYPEAALHSVFKNLSKCRELKEFMANPKPQS